MGKETKITGMWGIICLLLPVSISLLRKGCLPMWLGLAVFLLLVALWSLLLWWQGRTKTLLPKGWRASTGYWMESVPFTAVHLSDGLAWQEAREAQVAPLLPGGSKLTLSMAVRLLAPLADCKGDQMALAAAATTLRLAGLPATWRQWPESRIEDFPGVTIGDGNTTQHFFLAPMSAASAFGYGDGEGKPVPLRAGEALQRLHQGIYAPCHVLLLGLASEGATTLAECTLLGSAVTTPLLRQDLQALLA